jgi:Ni/Fe-hydrogenase 1 B-type cytochrome subunit
MENSATAQPTNHFFEEKHSILIRIWHWTFFLLMLSTLVMVFFAKQVFDTRSNAPMVIEEAEGRGVILDEKQARGIAHGFSEKLWVMHTWIGYGISILLLSRMVIEVVISKEEKTRTKIKKALTFTANSKPDKQDRLQYIVVRYNYLLFYLLMLTMALTGLGLAFEDYEFLQGQTHRLLKEIHEIVQYGIYAFIVMHLIGVVIADTTRHNGLVSRMIHGKGK